MLKTEQNKNYKKRKGMGMLCTPKHRKQHAGTQAGSYTFCSMSMITLPVLTQESGSWRFSKLGEATDTQSHFVSSNLEMH